MEFRIFGAQGPPSRGGGRLLLLSLRLPVPVLLLGPNPAAPQRRQRRRPRAHVANGSQRTGGPGTIA